MFWPLLLRQPAVVGVQLTGAAIRDALGVGLLLLAWGFGHCALLSKAFVGGARKGRASYLGPRSVGHQDPGATSTALILRALAETLAA